MCFLPLEKIKPEHLIDCIRGYDKKEIFQLIVGLNSLVSDEEFTEKLIEYFKVTCLEKEE